MDQNKQHDQLPILIPDEQGGPPRVRRISKKDKDIVETLISTGLIGVTARENHVEESYVNEVLNQPGIKEYISERLKHAAHKADLSEAKIFSKLNMVLDSDGKQKFDQSFIRAIEVASKILKLISPNSINVAQVNGANPFANKTDEELDAEIKKRMQSQ